jgi:hypothetical protein
MRTLCVAVLVMAASALPVARAQAWNTTGHMVVAKLAYAELTDGQKVAIDKLLRAHPHYKIFLAKDTPPGVSPAEWAFLRAATWPDWVKPDPKHPKPKEITAFNLPNLHFINRPFVNREKVRPEDKDKFEEKDLQPRGDTILTALTKKMETLADARATEPDKAVALCWLLHLVGDVHQPLHCIAMYSSDFPKRPGEKGGPGDRGGNDQLVLVKGRTTKLHAFWDDLLGTKSAYHAVELTAAGIGHTTRFKRDALKKELVASDFAAWAEESFVLARDVAYKGGKLRTQKLGHGHDEGEFEAPPLPDEYEDDAKEVARKRVALAGFRLADKLATAFPRAADGGARRGPR